MKTDDENGDEDDDDYDDDYDFADMECANVTFTPILRCFNYHQYITLQVTVMYHTVYNENDQWQDH